MEPTSWMKKVGRGLGACFVAALPIGCSSDDESISKELTPESCPTDTAWGATAGALEREVLEIVNRRRAEGATCGAEVFEPTGPLEMDPVLQCAARLHSEDMNDRGFFDHTNPDGMSPGERMEALGYTGNGWGENISGGQSTAEAVMEGWMSSDGHCSNIMDPSYSVIGVGYVEGGEWGHLWTQTFGN